MKLLISLAILVLLSTGCSPLRGKGGSTKTILPGGVTATVSQPENPKESTKQDVSGETEETYVVPAGSVIEQSQPAPATAKGETNAVALVVKITLSEPMPVVKKTKHVAATTIGAAQKDEIGAQIAAIRSFRWLQILGAVVFLFGVASAVYPPLKIIVGGSMTTSGAIALAGLLLIFLPPFFVEHEVLIFCCCIGGVAAWFLAHRHGSLKGELDTVKKYFTGSPPPAV